MGEAERGESAPRARISFWCSNGHETQPSFAHDAQVPDIWDCPRCGFPAGQDKDSPPVSGRPSALRSHAPDAAEPALRADGAPFETRPSAVTGNVRPVANARHAPPLHRPNPKYVQYTESPHRTPLLDGRTAPATAPAASPS